ncbi:hypothetical protein ANN_22587, partial [Periplaneta americana]
IVCLNLNYGLFNDARNCRSYINVAGVPEFCPAGVLLHATKSSDMSLSHLSTLKCHRPGQGSNPHPRAQKTSAVPTAPLRTTCVRAERGRPSGFVAFIDPSVRHFAILNTKVVVITEDVQNVHLLLEYRPHIDVSLTCEHDPKLQEYCVCPQNMPQFDSEEIPNQAPETNKPMILNGPTSRNREGSDQ